MSTTILFVDDESDVLDSLRRVFLEDEHQILTAQSGEQGLELIAENPVELVVADYRMPGMDGAELLTRVHARQDGTVGILLSAYADADLVNSLGQQGVIHTFIAKPWNDDQLRLAVKRALEHRRARLEQMRLRDELERMRRSLIHVPFQFVVFDPDGTAAVVHRTGARGAPFTDEPATGRHFGEFLTPAAAAAVKWVLDRGIAATIRASRGHTTARCLPGQEGCVLLVDTTGELFQGEGQG